MEISGGDAMPVTKSSNGKWRIGNGKARYRTKKNAEKVERVSQKIKKKGGKDKA